LVDPVADDVETGLANADAILVADYSRTSCMIGVDGVPVDLVARCAPAALIVQLAGGIDEQSLRKFGFAVWPDPTVPPRRMSRTFAALGSRPVIELHAAGLRVGELCARARIAGMSPEKVESTLPTIHSIAQAPAFATTTSPGVKP
jgi:hypothetical protein